MTRNNNPVFPLFRPLGDAGLLIEFGDCVDLVINRKAASFARVIREAGIPGILETVSTIKSVVLRFDPLVVSFNRLAELMQDFLDTGTWNDDQDGNGLRTWIIPVCYEADMAPDLSEMAKTLNLGTTEVVRLHGATEQRVLMIGFAPGFCYSGLLPDALHLPRRKTVTPEIPLGAIISAVGQTCIASTVMPTGWYEIGRTPVRNFQPDADPAVLIRAGDTISFTRITRTEFESLSKARDRGEWRPEQRLS